MSRLKKRADGRYYIQIYLGRDEKGKRIYKSVYAKSIPELKEKEAEVRLQMGRGLDLLSQRDQFEQWADDWLRLKDSSEITSREKDHYHRTTEFWKDTFIGYKIDEVRADDIERALLDLGKEGLSQRTINRYRSTLRQILNRAVGRVIPLNPESQVTHDAIGKAPVPRRALTVEEQRWIWETPHRAQPVAIIMMLSGLRRGELAALTWDDVDLDKQTITVNKVIEYDATGHPIPRPYTKTEAGMRVVDIPRKLVDYMRDMPRDNTLVIHTDKGKVMTPSAWTKLWNPYMRLLNIKYGTRTAADLKREKSSKPGPKTYEMTIPPITLHWFRHTYCTLLYLSGVDVLQACAQMGHADVSTTLRIYTHLDAIHKRKIVNTLDDYLSKIDEENSSSS